LSTERRATPGFDVSSATKRLVRRRCNAATGHGKQRPPNPTSPVKKKMMPDLANGAAQVRETLRRPLKNGV
jgi:hypothetical protein